MLTYTIEVLYEGFVIRVKNDNEPDRAYALKTWEEVINWLTNTRGKTITDSNLPINTITSDIARS